MESSRALKFKHIMELRDLINNIKNPRKFNEYFIKILKTNLKISEELLQELLEPCWGHVVSAIGDDVIDGPEQKFKINCKSCVKALNT